MKKITLLVCLLSIGSYAQENGSYSQETQHIISTSASSELVTITNRDSEDEQAIISTFTTLNAFNQALTDNCNGSELTSEDFSGGPETITTCGEVVSSVGGDCFASGELEEGFSVTSSDAGGTAAVVNIPPGAIGNIDSLVGASVFAEFTIINFDEGIYSAGFDIWENIDSSTDIRFFTPDGDLIETINVSIPLNAQTFFGFYANELIGSIEIQGASDSGELFGNFIFGGECSNLSIQREDFASISIYPNPTRDILTVNASSSITIHSLKLINLNGKEVLNVSNTKSLDMSNLSSGLYLLTISTGEGSTTQKVVKQ